MMSMKRKVTPWWRLSGRGALRRGGLGKDAGGGESGKEQEGGALWVPFLNIFQGFEDVDNCNAHV